MPRNEILGSDDSDDDGDDEDDESEEEEEEESMEITDRTGTNMQALRRTIYLTIQVSIFQSRKLYRGPDFTLVKSWFYSIEISLSIISVLFSMILNLSELSGI